jgi:Gnt-I system high-affinity gluconate transporter
MGAPLLRVGLPMSITLSTVHSFLSPHPDLTAVTAAFGASVGPALFYGLSIAVPTRALITPVWSRLPFIKAMRSYIPQGLVSERDFTGGKMTGLGWSLFPVALIVAAAVTDMATSAEPGFLYFVAFVGSAPIALMLTLCLAIWAFGPRVDWSLEEVGASCSWAAKAMAMVLLVIGAGGAFKNVFLKGGIPDYIKEVTDGWPISPIVLARLVAVILRIVLGSATVAAVTASGVVLPLLAGSGVHPEVMVLAVACGSIAFSHVNDPGFWLFKEYFSLSVIEAIKVRTSYTTVLAVLGMGGVLIAEQVLDVLNL